MNLSKKLNRFLLEVKKVAYYKHDSELIKKKHVYKIWNDGEITIEKAGNLYGMRNIHTIDTPVEIWTKYNLHKMCKFPMSLSSIESYAIVSGQDAQIIRRMMENF